MTAAIDGDRPTLTVKVSNIPQTVVARQLLSFLESTLGEGTVFAVEIFTEHKNWKSRGHGRVQFNSPEAKVKALSLSRQRKLVFKGFHLSISVSFEDIISRPVEPRNRVDSGGGLVMLAGVMFRDDCMGVLESWDGVKLWVMPERKKLELLVKRDRVCYKLEVQFGDVLETKRCRLDRDDRRSGAILLKLKHAPKIFRKISGPKVMSKFPKDRYHICKEDFDYLWVRTTDFSNVKSIGYMSSLCLEREEGFSSVDICTSLPYYSTGLMELELEGMKFSHASNLVPMVTNNSGCKVPYEALFQLNSLIHAQKMSLAAVDADLFQILSRLDEDTALLILKKMHMLRSTCYDPKSFIRDQSSVTGHNGKNLNPATYEKLTNQNIMSCHRVLVSPSKIFCLGPELETSNYIVKNFGSYASDFLRVTFVEEDWGRLPANAISTSIEQGIFGKPYRTDIYHRILSVLRDGIVIGDKKFQFLAFSASQLRSNSVWMFASNDHIKAEDIREWMGCFSNIRSISKCAARMGQLFSSSMQTLEVHPRDVDLIPDIEAISDGVKYCFSDGIGKISYAFARDIMGILGLVHVPSAFQIRYGGYKGVIVVDRQSFRKLALRGSMFKFESDNYMLNITKWSESQPCYLNREIVTLLSTLGVEDGVFLAMQEEQVGLLRRMLTNTGAALNVLDSSGRSEMKRILGRMLLQGYKPEKEPYLSTMLQSHLENQLSDLRSRCRIFVPKGRVLVGCLDETGTLEYGQVYVRVTMTKSELQCDNQTFFQRVDETTSVVVKREVVVTRNPCLHPGDVRVLEAVFNVKLHDNNLVDCLVFPQRGDRPHPNECSGGDLDGDLYFISWDENLIPPQRVAPMDYTGRRPRVMDHDVTLEEIQKFFVDYMINDTLGAISTAHLVHADREPDKALSYKCLELATLHSMAVDFAKTGAPAVMPRDLKPREFPDFMERWEKPTYVSHSVLGKLYRATIDFVQPNTVSSSQILLDAFDHDLIVDDYEAFLETAETHKEQYLDKMGSLLNYYGAENEVEILTGDLQRKSSYLQRDNRRYGEVKDRISVSVKSLMKEVKEWFRSSCSKAEQQQLASAWYYVTYHPTYCQDSANCLGFPWAVGDILLRHMLESSALVNRRWARPCRGPWILRRTWTRSSATRSNNHRRPRRCAPARRRSSWRNSRGHIVNSRASLLACSC